VNSLLEAFSNLAGVASIVIVQDFIDHGFGASVLVFMGFLSVVSAILLLGLSGRLLRHEAEAEGTEEPATETELTTMVEVPSDQKLVDKEEIKKQVSLSQSSIRCIALWAVLVNLLYTCLVVERMMVSDIKKPTLYEPINVRVSETKSVKVQRQANRLVAPTSKLRNGLAEPRMFLLHCSWKKKNVQLRKDLALDNITFSISSCTHGKKGIEELVQKRVLPHAALDSWEQNKKARHNIARAASHMHIWHSIVKLNIPRAHIMEDSESICPNFRKRRNDLLGRLPLKIDIVALNPRSRIGEAFADLRNGTFTGPVQRLQKGNKLTGILKSYVLTSRWAKKMLNIGFSYHADTSEGPNVHFSDFMFTAMRSSPQLHGWHGYAINPGTLSFSMDAGKVLLNKPGPTPNPEKDANRSNHSNHCKA